MAKSETEIKVRLVDVEGIHGLIESLAEVADKATKTVHAYEMGDLFETDLESRINQLKLALIALNDYVDEHLHDE